jgi:hypothetical protein
MAMTCADAQDLIEMVAAGEAAPDGPLALHLAGCRTCAAALDVASRIERALITRGAPPAPAGFAQRVVATIRRERWRSEERMDRAFNLTIAVAIAAVGVALVSLFNVGSLAQMLLAAVDTISRIPQQPSGLSGAAPLPVLGLTAAVATMALVVWWWAERRSDYEQK